MERLLLASARDALAQHPDCVVVFVGDSLEFLVDLHSQAATLPVCPPLARVPSSPASLIADHRVLFVTYGVLQALVACGVLQASQIALLITDNIMEADIVMATFAGTQEPSPSQLPKVRCVVVPTQAIASR